MTSSDFLTDPQQILVADTSVLINLNGTGCALEILEAVPGSFFITDRVFSELARGTKHGHTDVDLVQRLVEAGAATVSELGQTGIALYRPLVDGNAQSTLDDGEASTIAYAQEVSGVALIDERKARSICSARFPGLTVGSTVDLLVHDAVSQAIGADRLVQALKNALHYSRMRVPPHNLDVVVELIGAREAANCASLPRQRRPSP